MKSNILYLSDMPADVTLNPQEHNYIKLIAAHVPGELLQSGAHIIDVAHDDWCKIFQHGNCNCRPRIKIKDRATHKVVFAIRWRR